MLHAPTSIASVLVGLTLAACGGDDGGGDQRADADRADPKRYCALTRDLDAAGEKFFSKLGENARPEEFEAAERRFVKRFGGKLEQLARAAPKEIRADARTLLTAQRQRAGLEPTM